MEKDELFEEIRALLTEPLDAMVTPYTYSDEQLTTQVRSALRRISAKGVSTDAVMSLDGDLNPEPTESVGLLLAYSVASALLRGDMVQKLNTGEIGVYARMGSDILDTKTVANSMKTLSSAYDEEFKILLTIVLSDPDTAADNVFGDDTLSV